MDGTKRSTLGRELTEKEDKHGDMWGQKIAMRQRKTILQLKIP